MKTKSARESHFCPFFRFSSREEKLFHGHFFRFFPVFFTGTKNRFHGQNLSKSYHFRGENCSKFFTGTDFFHGWNFDENLHGYDFPFTGTFWAKTSFFSREDFFYFHGEKKHWGWVLSICITEIFLLQPTKIIMCLFKTLLL